jgi:hypothetical protein
MKRGKAEFATMDFEGIKGDEKEVPKDLEVNINDSPPQCRVDKMKNIMSKGIVDHRIHGFEQNFIDEAVASIKK